MTETVCATAIGRFAATGAEDLAILCRPDPAGGGVFTQARDAWRAWLDALAAAGAGPGDVVREAVFLRDVADLPAILAAREQALAEAAVGRQGSLPVPAVIGQPPAGGAALEVLAWARVARVVGGGAEHAVSDLRPESSCGCAACALAGARLTRAGGETLLHAANLHGQGADLFAEALDAFRAAARLLGRAGLSFRDVVRTWVHLRDIDQDYDALNAARREFFRESGIDLRPASTGVEGTPVDAAHDVALGFVAMRSDRPLAIVPMTTPLLNEAWSYGADFSRGLRIDGPGATTLHVSGTASIDELGRSAHPGDVAAQVGRMLDNLESLLAAQRATVADVVSGIVYLSDTRDAGILRSLVRERGFDGFPCAVVGARLCRAELLCEAEILAMLPHPPALA